MLDDLERYAAGYGRDEIGGPHTARVQRGREHIGRLRTILEQNRPVDLTSPAEADGQRSRASRPRTDDMGRTIHAERKPHDVITIGASAGGVQARCTTAASARETGRV